MMEQLLHYIWQYRLFPEALTTLSGQSIEVVDTGQSNRHSGPDFFNAKIKIDGILWVGDVEMHTRSSGWRSHGHDRDASYNPVVLHVVEYADESSVVRADGTSVPQLVMTIPDSVKANAEYLMQSDLPARCLPFLSLLPRIELSAWLDHLMVERLMQKTVRIDELYALYQGDWEEIFYVLLCRSFGFGLNSEPFERMARSLPFKIIRKHSDSITDVEALLFGQMGFLGNPSPHDSYERYLQERYRLFAVKYQLQPLSSSGLKWFRTRPGSFPEVRIAQLAKLLHNTTSLFSKLLECHEAEPLKALFRTSVSFYWRDSSSFADTSPFSMKRLSDSSLHIMLINVVVPLRFAYYNKKGNDAEKESTLQLLLSLPAESNQVVRSFIAYGVTTESAADSQALIQLKREYCERRRCLQCRWGASLIRKRPNMG